MVYNNLVGCLDLCLVDIDNVLSFICQIFVDLYYFDGYIVKYCSFFFSSQNFQKRKDFYILNGDIINSG